MRSMYSCLGTIQADISGPLVTVMRRYWYANSSSRNCGAGFFPRVSDFFNYGAFLEFRRFAEEPIFFFPVTNRLTIFNFLTVVRV